MSDQVTPQASEKIYGMVAAFPGPNDLIVAARQVRDAGYRRWDVHSPFPIHGMDEAMGEGQSRVGLIAGFFGFLGLVGGYLLQWWTQAVDYPVVIGGKPYNSYQAWVIICFGLTILMSALGAVIGMLVLNRLPRWFDGLFYSEQFSTRATDDGFFVSIESSDPKFNEQKTKSFLESIGGKQVEVLKGL